MKLSSGKRIGQSGGELAAAAFFSFFLHGVVIIAVALLYVHAAPKKYFPPVYDVKLVGLPAGPTEQLPLAQAPQAPPAPAPPPEPPKQEAKALPKLKKTAPKASKASRVPKAAAKKGTMPELAKPSQKPAPTPEPPKPEELEQPAASAGKTPAGPAASGAKGENIAVTAPQQGFKFGYYLGQVRDKISQNWRPPPDAPEAKVRVVFSINRSGWVSRSDVNIDEKNSNGSYQFKLAAVRAILSATPFPQLPDDFPKQTLELTVDLMAEQ